jgi:hypothetical protein
MLNDILSCREDSREILEVLLNETTRVQCGLKFDNDFLLNPQRNPLSRCVHKYYESSVDVLKLNRTVSSSCIQKWLSRRDARADFPHPTWNAHKG